MAREGHSRQKVWHGQRSEFRKAGGPGCARNGGKQPEFAEGAMVPEAAPVSSSSPSLPPPPRNNTTRLKWSSSWQSMVASTSL